MEFTGLLRPSEYHTHGTVPTQLLLESHGKHLYQPYRVIVVNNLQRQEFGGIVISDYLLCKL